MYNKVVLVGNLTRNVEIRYSQSGSAIGKVGIATNRTWKSQTGEQKNEVMFIDLTFFGRVAEIANQYLKRGSKVLVDGRLVFEQWTAQDGTKRSKHSIMVETLKMLDSKSDSPDENFGRGYMNQPTMSGSMDNRTFDNTQSTYQQNINASMPPQQSYSQPQQQQPLSQQQPSVPEIDIDEDEIPF